jgi:RNA polymerase sigma-70 factor (ECF subfamily)
MKAMEREFELWLVRRMRAGDTAAFDDVYSEFNARLYNFLRHLSRSADVAEDLLEETWLRFVSSGATLDQDTRLAPWLFTIARNLYVNYCRSRGREQSYTSDVLLWPDDRSPSPLQTAMLNELQGGIEAALAALPTKYREALLLVGVERMRPAEAAAVCGIAADAFRQRLSRARALLSRKLNESGLLEHTEERSYDRRSAI